jgi:transposase
LSDQSFSTILKFLNQENVVITCQESVKTFFRAVLHIIRTGIPWRNLLKEYGKRNSVFQKFNRWNQKGIWKRLKNFLMPPEAASDVIMIDSTVIRAHPCAAGYEKGDGFSHGLGYSKGGVFDQNTPCY